MSNKRSAGSFCSLVVSTTTGLSDSVASLLLNTYGDGAEVYCIANGATYRMDAAITVATVGDTAIAPNTGTGTWIKQNFQVDLSLGITGSALLVGAAFSGLVVNTWHALPTGANFFEQNPLTSNFWSLDTTTGILTYNGFTGLKFLFNTTLGIINSGTVPQTLSIDLTGNGALNGTTTTTVNESHVTTPGIAGATTLLVHNTIVQGNAGQTYQYVFRDLASPNGTFTVDKYQVMITAL